MISLTTNYAGLTLRNPVIISSSGLTDSVEKIKKLEESEAGAVVLKSLFEEQIKSETGTLIQTSDYPEAEDYLNYYVRSNKVDQYLTLIEQSKTCHEFYLYYAVFLRRITRIKKRIITRATRGAKI